MTKLLKGCFWIFLLFHASPSSAAAAPWTQHARDLFTGDEEKAAKSKEWFRSQPGAMKELVAGLKDQDEKHLALDALVALQNREVVPFLLENLVTNRDGSYALALSALMNEENAQLILGRFKRLLESDASAALPMALVLPALDTLGRLRVPLSSGTFTRLLSHYGPEVRLSLASYLRQNVTTQPRPYPEWLFDKRLGDPVHQVRLAALALQREFPSAFPRSSALKTCRREKQDLLLKFCQRFIWEEPAP